LKTNLISVLVALLVSLPAAQTVTAQPQNHGPSTDQIRIKVAKLGVGEKARATISLKDGSKIKGYVYSAGDEEFVMRDRQTNSPTTIKYADVTKVDRNQGHSIAKIVLLAVAAGTAITLLAVYGAIARNER
jgi:hypothetical protein